MSSLKICFGAFILACTMLACLDPGQNSVSQIVKSSGKGLELRDGSIYDFPNVAKGDSSTMFFLLHHAEANEGNDPYLSTDGRMRSHHLEQVLGDAGIQLIFTTSEKKSMATIEVLSTLNSIKTVGYSPDKAKDLVQTIQTNDKGRRILIVGSDTDLNPVLEALQGETQDLQISPEVYNQIIVCRKGTETRCRRFTY